MEAIGDFDTNYDAWRAVENAPPVANIIKQMEYIPIVSTIVGVCRIAFGLLKTCFGLLALPFQLIASACKWKSRELIFVDGLAHIVRGVVALEPIGGNIILFVYDRAMANRN